MKFYHVQVGDVLNVAVLEDNWLPVLRRQPEHVVRAWRNVVNAMPVGFFDEDNDLSHVLRHEPLDEETRVTCVEVTENEVFVLNSRNVCFTSYADRGVQARFFRNYPDLPYCQDEDYYEVVKTLPCDKWGRLLELVQDTEEARLLVQELMT